MDALSIQIGGGHYDKPYQPIMLIVKLSLSFIQGNIVKYVTRHKDKNGIEDLKKVKHYAQFGLQFYGTIPRRKFHDLPEAYSYCKANKLSKGETDVTTAAIMEDYLTVIKRVEQLAKAVYGEEI